MTFNDLWRWQPDRINQFWVLHCAHAFLALVEVHQWVKDEHCWPHHQCEIKQLRYRVPWLLSASALVSKLLTFHVVTLSWTRLPAPQSSRASFLRRPSSIGTWAWNPYSSSKAMLKMSAQPTKIGPSRFTRTWNRASWMASSPSQSTVSRLKLETKTSRNSRTSSSNLITKTYRYSLLTD